MFFNLSLKGLRSLSKPIVVRLTALVLLLSLALPMVMFSEWNTAKARAIDSKPRPAAAPPERFMMPGENRGWESLGERLSGWSSDVAGLFATKDPQTDANSQTADSGVPEQVSITRVSNISEEKSAKDTSTEIVTEESTVAETEPNAEKVESTAVLSQPAGSVDFDFDGDGKSDIGRWHPATKEFKVKKSNGGTFLTVTFSSASSSAKPAPADYDNDGMTDAAVFDAGTWYIRKSSDSSTSSISFGQAGDIPMSGDYRGDGADELAVYRPGANGYWYWREFSNSTSYNLQWGGNGGEDIPAAGDFDGDGKMDWTVYRPSTGTWWICFNDLSGYTSAQWGASYDIPTAADYDGDGKTDPAIWRPTTGQWWFLKSSTSWATYSSASWGNIGDQPVVGDFDDDDEADFTIFRPSTGKFHTWTSQSAYQSAELGVAGDTAIPSSYVKQVGSSITPDIINKERLKPRNATGGTDLFSQNLGWSRNLVSLPGRSGMDLNLGLSYNSLIWTKVGSSMLFDMDAQTGMAPGFHTGFPTIEPAYYDDDTDKWNYLMVTPGGAKVEFRQTISAANVYETHDSSYAQLTTTGATYPDDPVDTITLVVVTTDGTQMFYDWIAGAFRCTSVRDRNGNYFTITYEGSDRGIDTITDTLGRVLTFNYTDQNLTSITQTWKTNNGADSNTTHTYATFTYGTKTIATDFHSSLAVWGLVNGTDLKVLDKVTYGDGSFTKFYYNDYAQAYKIEEHAADSGGTAHVLNHVRVNLNSTGDYALSADQPDCPRFTKVWNKVENFNSGTETLTDITRTTGQPYTSPAGGAEQTLTKVEVEMDGHPHNAISKSWYGESGWKDGLPIATEDWADGTSGSERKRWTLTNYTQDDTGVAYQTNPRMTESKVGDGTNTKRTTIDYELYASSTVAKFGLPSVVRVYDADQTTILKESTTTYNFDSNLISRRIIGLPLTVEAEGYNQLTSSMELVSKVSYAYDEGNFSDSSLVQSVSPVQWDSTNYGTGFSYRGNLTSTKRWDTTAPATNFIPTATLKYNTAGSVVSKTTPWDGTQTRTVRIGYADSFNSSPGVTTNAYPTVITDPAGTSLGASGHSSFVKYRYDIGANVEAESPAPAGQTEGKTSKRIFDSVGRLERNSVYVNTTEHSYVRYEYPTNGVQTKTYAPIVDVNNNGNIAEDEVYSESWHDGAGRVRMSLTEHPGSNGGWASTFVEYDILGRVKRQSVPTETNSSYTPAGDDSAGPLWTYQKYDWMGRVVRKINTDGIDQTTLNDSDILISYEGCGCAGGLVTTVQGELVPRTDPTGGNARRVQKSYADILGRPFKTESYEWDGTTVYSTAVQTFDGADRPVLTRQYAGTTSSGTYQDTTASFDGHGRLASSHRPEQRDTSNNLKYTTYSYNPDDSILSVTDGRGAMTNFEYNSRGLLTGKSWTVPGGSGIQDPTDVTYTYDNLGNRTAMTDGAGNVSYEYSELSRLTAETRQFSDTLANAPLSSNRFKLEYTYSLSGGLKSYKDPYGQQINHSNDKIGRQISVTGTTSFAGVTTYTDGLSYRAWGGLKSYAYGNSVQMISTFNNRLQVDSFNLSRNGQSEMQKEYEYYADGRLKYVQDFSGTKFDRSNSYDHVGRIKEAKSGAEARGQTANTPLSENLPYRQSFGYDAFGNMTTRNNLHWGIDYWYGATNNLSYSFTNNRIDGSFRVYDVEGRITQSWGDGDSGAFGFDAAGQMTGAWQPGPIQSTITNFRDGDGLEVKREKMNFVEDEEHPNGEWIEEPPKYYIRSSVMGGEVVSEANSTGKKLKTSVYGVGQEVASQTVQHWNGNEIPYLNFDHWDASGMSHFTSFPDGSYGTAIGYETAPAELDPMGSNAGTQTPYVVEEPVIEPPENPAMEPLGTEDPMRVNGMPVGVTRDGIAVPQSVLLSTVQGKEFSVLGWQAARTAPRLVGNYVFGTDRTEIYSNSAAGMRNAYRTEAINPTWLRVWAVSDNSWAINWSLIAFQTKQVKGWEKLFDEQPGIKNHKNLHFKSVDSAKTLLKMMLDSGNCRAKIAELISKFGSAADVAPITTDLEKLFTQIAGQDKGGFTFNLPQTSNLWQIMADKINADWGDGTKPGQSEIAPWGLATRVSARPVGGFNYGNQAYVLMQDASFNSTYPRTRYVDGKHEAAAGLGRTLIHELLHVAASSGTYRHHGDARLEKALKELGSSNVQTFLYEHCKLPNR